MIEIDKGRSYYLRLIEFASKLLMKIKKRKIDILLWKI